MRVFSCMLWHAFASSRAIILYKTRCAGRLNASCGSGGVAHRCTHVHTYAHSHSHSRSHARGWRDKFSFSEEVLSAVLVVVVVYGTLLTDDNYPSGMCVNPNTASASGGGLTSVYVSSIHNNLSMHCFYLQLLFSSKYFTKTSARTQTLCE